MTNKKMNRAMNRTTSNAINKSDEQEENIRDDAQE
jgi:hypothetical protein